MLSGLKVMGYSCSEARSMSLKTESFGVTSWRNITISMLLDMQATLRPLKWNLEITGGHRCCNTSASTSRPVICAIEQSYSTIDPLENSTPLRLWKSDGT
jgi:hypothetical protein